MHKRPIENSDNSELLTKKQDNIQNFHLFVEKYKKKIPIIWNLHFHDIIFAFISAFYIKLQKLTLSNLHNLIQVYLSL